MFVLPFLVSPCPQPPPLIAYVARYYAADPKVKTQNGLYVCGWDGSGRRTVATTKKEVYAVVWSGRDRLVWFCDGGTDADEVWTGTLAGGDSKLIGRVSGPEPWHSEPGVPHFQNASASDPVWYTVGTDGGLTKTVAPVDPFVSFSHDLSSKDGSWSLRIGDDEDKLVLFDASGSSKELPHKGMFFDAKVEPSKDRVWIRTRDHDSTRGVRFWLYTVDWAGMRLIPRIEDYAMADFWPSRDATVYCLPRSLAKLGKKSQVWVSPMFAGNVRTGQFKRIVSGLVQVQWAAVQPD